MVAVRVRAHRWPVGAALEARLRRRTSGTEVAPSHGKDAAALELLEGRYGDWRVDVYSAAGDGSVAPSLSEATPREIYGEFEHGEEAPRDRAP